MPGGGAGALKKSFRSGVRLGLLGGVVAAVAAARRTSRRAPVGITDSGAPAWVEAEGGACPDGYPVKAKLSSHLFHLPGMLAYDRTKPDRCFADAAAAEADGFTRARR